MKDWRDWPRRSDTIALVGFSSLTRDDAPWGNPDVEIMGVNEGYSFPWMKRWDRWFQIHPRWDLERKNNLNDPNHFHWLTNETAPCVFCKGLGKTGVTWENTEMKGGQDCIWCKGTGTYTPPKTRSNAFPIYMQQEHPDIPNSVKFPILEITKRFLPSLDYPYFSSSLSMMIAMAAMMDYKRIELYGFEMASGSEYSYQKPNAEFWIGLLKGLGYDIYIPKRAPILKGELYAYQSMRMGYRQQLDFRLKVLESQQRKAERALSEVIGQIKILKTFEQSEAIQDLLLKKSQEQLRQHELIQILKGATRETQNLTDMYDKYFTLGYEGGENPNTDMQNFVTVEYINEQEKE